MDAGREDAGFEAGTAVSSGVSTEAQAAVPENRYLAWKKNAAQLYDTMLAFELPWPSQTAQWIPERIAKKASTGSSTGADASSSEDAPTASTRQRLVLATSTGGQATEYLRIAELLLPELRSGGESLKAYDQDAGVVGGYQPAYAADLRIVQRIQARGSIARARHMPQNPNIIATVSSTGEAALWDTTKFPYKPVAHYVPTTALVGHTGEGLAVAWSPTVEGQLATSDIDGNVLIWDIRRGFDASRGTLDAAQRRTHAPGTAVNDLAWHPRRPQVLASVGDDGLLIIHNTSSGSGGEILRYDFDAGARPTAVAWNPVNESLLAVGFDTGAVELWDVRAAPVRIHAFTGSRPNNGAAASGAHTDYITTLHWNTWHPSVFASASVDGTVKVWNAVRFGDTPLITHGGHNAPVTDVAWNPAEQGTLVSVAEDNGLHIWRPADDILGF